MPKKPTRDETVKEEEVSAPVEVIAEEPVRVARVRNESAPEVKVPFKSWLIMKLGSEPRLQPHHAEALFVYMVGRGLREEDAAWKYDAALREYFGG
jgi:hypothetical protein